jgi:hypothetical protein
MGLFDFGGGANLPDLPDTSGNFSEIRDLIDSFGEQSSTTQDELKGLNDDNIAALHSIVSRYGTEAGHNFDFGNELRGLYKNKALPGEVTQYNKLMNYDTDARREQYAGQAAQDVQRTADEADKAQAIALQREGIDPNDPRYAAARSAGKADVAAASAAAEGAARTGVEERGLQYGNQAVDLGRGWADLGGKYSAEGVRDLGLTTGAIGDVARTYGATMGTPMQWQQDQLNTIQQLINNRMSRYDAKLGRTTAKNDASAGLGGAIGTLGGAALGLYMGGSPYSAAVGANIGGSVFGGGGR